MRRCLKNAWAQQVNEMYREKDEKFLKDLNNEELCKECPLYKEHLQWNIISQTNSTSSTQKDNQTFWITSSKIRGEVIK